MKKVNLRDLYPDVYKSDHFVEVTEDVLETIRDSERAEAAYDRRIRSASSNAAPSLPLSFGPSALQDSPSITRSQ